MAKLTAWLVTIIGLWLILAELGLLDSVLDWQGWIIALAVTAIGVGKLVRNYSKK
jgi:membrane protein implicated in regulation of membrane protease activity